MSSDGFKNETVERMETDVSRLTHHWESPKRHREFKREREREREEERPNEEASQPSLSFALSSFSI
jgi:hypothetical protein